MLLAAGAWSLDVAFFIILALGTLMGVARGMVKSLCKLAGLIFSVIVAFMFCVSFQNCLEEWFGLTSALVNAIGNAKAGAAISVVIAFVALVILVRLASWLIGKAGTALVDKFKPFRVINHVAGGILGMFEAFMLIMFIFAVCYWIPSEDMHLFILDSRIAGKVYEWVASELAQLDFNAILGGVTGKLSLV